MMNLTVYLHICHYPTVHAVHGQHYGIHVHSSLPYPTVHPVLLYHGQDGQCCGIQVSI